MVEFGVMVIKFKENRMEYDTKLVKSIITACCRDLKELYKIKATKVYRTGCNEGEYGVLYFSCPEELLADVHKTLVDHEVTNIRTEWSD